MHNNTDNNDWVKTCSREDLESFALRAESQEKLIISLFSETSDLKSQVKDLSTRLESTESNLSDILSFLDDVRGIVVSNKIYTLYDSFRLESPKPTCPFSCKICANIIDEDCTDCDGTDALDYCYNKCNYCTQAHAVKSKIYTKSIERDVRKSINRNQDRSLQLSVSNHQPKTLVSSPSYNTSPIGYNILDNMANTDQVPQTLIPAPSHHFVPDHRYIFVTLTVSPDWGSYGYLKDSLVKNFLRMFPASTEPIASAYVIENTEIGTPHLHGIIRYGKKGLKISDSMSIYKNEIQIEGTKGKDNRVIGMKTIENLSTYSNRTYFTNSSLILEKWNYMKKDEGLGAIIVGDPLDRFL